MELIEAMSTTRSIRRYRPDPVDDQDLLECLRAATFAPSGSNLQNWRFCIARGPELRAALGRAYRGGWDEYTKDMGLEVPAAEDTSKRARFIRSMEDFVNEIEEAPVYVVCCMRFEPTIDPVLNGALIFPAVQNLLLAARQKGLGTVYTTWFTREEAALREIVGVPDDWLIAAVLPIGYPRGSHGPVRRKPVSEVVCWETWSGEAPDG